MTLDDEHIGRNLRRRVESDILTDRERDQILAAVRAPRMRGRPTAEWLRWAAAGALVVAVAIATIPLIGGRQVATPGAGSSPVVTQPLGVGTATEPPRSLVPATATPTSEADPQMQRARVFLDQWEDIVRGANPETIVFTAGLSRGGGYRGRGANERKSAAMAGLFTPTVELPTDEPPAAEVTWEDGVTSTVQLISADRALADLKESMGHPSSCAECKPLRVTGARLTSREFPTAHGMAVVPVWEFEFVDADKPVEPIVQVAVRDATVMLPTESGQMLNSANAGREESTVEVNFSVGLCDDAEYAADAVESDLAVVVIVRPIDPGPPDASPGVCAAGLRGRTAVAQLSGRLADRVVLDYWTGVPITLYRDSPT